MEYFSGYGTLSYLARTDYFRGDWEYCESADAPDGTEYDIVRNPDGSEYRYTSI